jgi:hypothetical protein
MFIGTIKLDKYVRYYNKIIPGLETQGRSFGVWIDMTFHPNNNKNNNYCCKSYKWIQMFETNDGTDNVGNVHWGNYTHWIDPRDPSLQNNPPSPIYNLLGENGNDPNNIEFYDSPSYGKQADDHSKHDMDVYIKFETCIACKEKEKKLHILQCVTWGLNIKFKHDTSGNWQRKLNIASWKCSGKGSKLLRETLNHDYHDWQVK